VLYIIQYLGTVNLLIDEIHSRCLRRDEPIVTPYMLRQTNDMLIRPQALHENATNSLPELH
jgi:hypothetical protein